MTADGDKPGADSASEDGVDKATFLELLDKRKPPVAEGIGFKVADRGDGEATITYEVKEEHKNRMDSLQGGLFCVVADAAMGMAFGTLLGPGEALTTLEMKMNFMKAVRGGTIRAEGKILRDGRRIGVAECKIFDDQDRLVAHGSCTMMRIKRG